MFNVRLSKKLDTGTASVTYWDESFLFATVEEVGLKLEEYKKLYMSELTATPYIEEQNDIFFNKDINDIKPSCCETSCVFADVFVTVIRIGVLGNLIYNHDWNQDSFEVFDRQPQSEFYSVNKGVPTKAEEAVSEWHSTIIASDQYMCMMYLIIRELKKKYVFDNFNYKVGSNIVTAQNIVYYRDTQLISCTVNGSTNIIHHAYDIELLVGNDYSYVYQ